MKFFQKRCRPSHPAIYVKPVKTGSSQPAIQPLESRRFLSITPAIELLPDASSKTVTGYTPAEVSTAYGFTGLTFNSGKTAANGAGQTIAIVDEYNDPNISADLETSDSSLGTLNDTTNTLPTLYSLESNSSTYSADFRDITTGASPYSIEAGTGYDLVTGIGSAKANKLIPALVSSKISTTLTPTSVVQSAPPPPGGGYFVCTTAALFAGSATVPTPNSLTTTSSNLSPMEFEGALFQSNVAHGNASVANSSSTPADEDSIHGVTSAAVGSWVAQVSQASLQLPANAAWSPSPAALSAVQMLEQELAGVSLYAQEMISNLGRDFEIDFAHSESSDDGSMLASLAESGSGLRNFTIATVATAAAIACLRSELNKEKAKTANAFSNRMIQMV